LIGAFDGGEDLIDHICRQLGRCSLLQERDALRPVLLQRILRTLFDEERHASNQLEERSQSIESPLIAQGFSLRLEIAEFEELQSNRDRKVEDVDESRGSSEIAFGGHA
jgi:hypothetical protein